MREELGLLLSTVEKLLQSKDLTWGNVVYVRLFLEDMASFGAANEVYVKHITEQKCENGVPSRCCVQVCLPEASMGGVLLEVAAASDSSKQVLHVQSISCWAPCCIGPYSQVLMTSRDIANSSALFLYLQLVNLNEDLSICTLVHIAEFSIFRVELINLVASSHEVC